MSLNLKSSGGGSVTVDVPSTASNYTATIQAADGTLSPLVSGTAVASTSGTSIDFTGIPSWVKRITLMFNAVSLSGTSQPRVQLGGGSITTTGYIASTSYTNSSGVSNSSNITSGFDVNSTFANAGNTFSGSFIFTNVSGNIWTCMSILAAASSNNFISGVVTIGGTLDRVRITTVNGTDTFDAGSINILYE